MAEQIPAELTLVRDLVNTADLEKQEDLGSPADLRAFLRERDLIGTQDTVGDRDLATFVEVREALRRLLRSHAGDAVDEDAVRTLDRAAASVDLRARVDDDGVLRLEPAETGCAGALGCLLADVLTATHLGSWPRLKVCAKETCQWAYYDRSKNRSGRWCSMEVCGNRVKTRTYRERHAPSPG